MIPCVTRGKPSLTYEGTEFDDSNTVSSFIKPESILHYWVYPSVHVFVKTLTERKIPLEVALFDTIESIKIQIQGKEGAHPTSPADAHLHREST